MQSPVITPFGPLPALVESTETSTSPRLGIRGSAATVYKGLVLKGYPTGNGDTRRDQAAEVLPRSGVV